MFVLLGDMGKGALAVVVAERFGVDAPLVVLPAGAAGSGSLAVDIH